MQQVDTSVAETIGGHTIIAKLDRLGRIIRACQFAQSLNPAQWEALRYLSRANRASRTPGGLAEFLGATKGTVSQTLMSLEDKGLVSRSKSRVDRRVVILDLTSAGAAALALDPLRPLEAIADDMGPDTAGDLARMLDQLFATIQKRRDLRNFGVCWRCQKFISLNGAGPSQRCGLTGESIDDASTQKLCINFAASDVAAKDDQPYAAAESAAE